jgi:hypothetical protein
VYTRPEKILGKRKNSNNIGSFFNPTGCCLSNKKQQQWVMKSIDRNNKEGKFENDTTCKP